MSLNIAEAQFRGNTLIETLKEGMDRYKIQGSSLTVEITENIMFSHLNNYEKVLQNIHDLGIHIAIDDFGAGYSVVGELASFPIHILKIDKLFADHLNTDNQELKKRTLSILRGIVSIAKELDIKTIGEGIETEDQFQEYKNIGFDCIQGYYFSKP